MINRLSASPAGFVVVSGLLALTVLTIPKFPLGADFESGWSSVLDHAHETGFQFGTEIVFPYGPLGFLLIPHFASHTDALRLVFDCLLGYAVSAAVCLLAWRFQLGWRLLTIAIFALVAANKQIGAQELLLDLGFLSWGLLCLRASGPRLVLCLVLLVVLAAFGALVKITFFFTASLTVFVICLDLFLRGKRWLGLAPAAGFLCFVPLLWIVMGQNWSNLPIFVQRTMDMCAGYDQAMAWQPRGVVLSGGITVALLACALVVFRCLAGPSPPHPAGRQRRWLVLAWLVALLFLAWKHGFVRGDPHHVYFFFGFVAVFVLLLGAPLHANGRLRSWAYGWTGLTCLLAITSLQISLYPEFLGLDRCLKQVGANATSLLRPVAYRAQLNEELSRERRETELPAVRQAIGAASVDVFGNRQAPAILTVLNYRPRPVFQSYAAYNAALSQLNEDFYLSARAPEYVLATMETIDRRFLPLEDALVFRNLLINYDLSGVENGFLLLRSRSQLKPKLTLLSEGTIRPGRPLDLTAFGDTNIWLQINVEPTAAGRVRQFLYQSPSVHLGVWCAAPAKSPQEFCAPASMLAVGFLASPLLADDEDLLTLYAGKPGTRPLAYSVELGPSAASWKSAIHFRIYGIENLLGAQHRVVP